MQKRLIPGQITFIHCMLLLVLLVKIQRPNLSTAALNWAVSLMPLISSHQLPAELFLSSCCFSCMYDKHSYSTCIYELRCVAWKFGLMFLCCVCIHVCNELIVSNKRNFKYFPSCRYVGWSHLSFFFSFLFGFSICSQNLRFCYEEFS